jgi:predicted PurR-regulated permease PerM
MARAVNPSKTSRFVLLASVCVVVAALYFAQEVLIPLALAVLLTFLFTPIVTRLERWRVPRAVAVVLVVMIAFGGFAALGYVVGKQILELARNIDTYKGNIIAKVERIRPGRSDVMDKLANAAADVQDKLEGPATTQASKAATKPTELVAQEIAQRTDTPRTVTEATKGEAPNPATQPTRENPLPVAVVEPAPSPMQTLARYLGLALGPLGTAGIVIVFVIFMLLQREDLRNRVIRLIGYGQLTVTTQALDDAASRISRYLVAQAIVNGTYGAAIAIGLWLIGKFVAHDNPPFPNVILWGLLCCILRFIPYIGPWIAAAFPLVISLAVYRSFNVFIATTCMFVVIELLSNNIMEPLLYGSSTGMSAVAVLVAAVFWTWLWGPIGLLLSTPLTVCLVVLGKYVPTLQFLDILLGDEPVLAPHERLYQRWLALDHEEAADLVHEFFTDRSLEDVYDSILIPAMALAEQDRHKGRLDDQRWATIRQSVREMIDELGDDYRLRFAQSGASTATVPGKAPETSDSPAEDVRHRLPLGKDCRVNIVVLPAHDEADEIVGLMLDQILDFNNYCGTAVSQSALAGEMIETVQSKNAHAVCVSALPPAAVAHSRYLCKRLHMKLPELKMVVGLWTWSGELKRAKDRVACEGSVNLVTTLGQAMDEIEQATQAVVAQQSETRNGNGKPATGTAASSTSGPAPAPAPAPAK